MNKNILTVILLLIVISSAQALIQPEKTEISMSPTESFSIPVKIVNQSGERALIHLSSDSVLNTEFAANDFYLNANEETKIAFNIMPSYSGAYEVELKLEYAERTENATIMVAIGDVYHFGSVKNCGDNFDCFIEATKTCSPAKLTHTLTINWEPVFGFTQTTSGYYEIKGMEAGECVLYSELESISAEFTEEMVQEMLNAGATLEEIELAEQQLNEEMQKTVGVGTTCRFSQSKLTETFEKMKIGSYSSTDWETCEIGNTGKISFSGGIELRYQKQNICQNKLDKLTLWIKNDSSVTQEVKLSAESTIFTPTIEPNFLELDAGEERFIQLELYSNRTFPIDEEYSVIVNLETDDTMISREIFFNLTECIKTEKLFRVDLQTEHISLKKGEDKRVYFTVENLDEEDNELFFAVKTDLKNELQQTKTVLSKGQKRTYWIELEALKTNDVGKHKVELFAFNPFYDVKKVFYVEVRGIHEVEVTLVSEVAEIERGASGIFTILVENKGDFEERIRTNYEEKENFNVNIADESFYLQEKESKKIYVSVNPNVTAELGEQEIEVKVNGEEIYLNFKVVEGENPRKTDGVVEFLSVPEKITLSQEETEIKVLIKNISGEKIENIVFWIESLPEGVVFESTTVEEIKSEKIKYVEGKLLLDLEEAEKGSYDITLVVENSQFRQKKEIQLVVLEPEKEEEEEEEEKENPNPLAGLFSLGSGELIGLIVLVLIVIILLLNPGKERRLNRKRGN